MPKSSISRITTALILAVTGSGGLLAADAPQSADDAFKEKGLVRMGFWLVLPQEAELHAAVNNMKEAKQAAGAAGLNRASLVRSLKGSTDAIAADENRLSQLKDQLTQTKNDPTRYNQIVDQYNGLLASYKQELSKAKETQAELDKLPDPKRGYERAVNLAQEQVAKAQAAYARLAADTEIPALVARYSKDIKPPLRLGPSTGYAADVDLVKKTVSDIAAAGIPLVRGASVPLVDAVINNTGPVRMVWDSGCTGVSLSAKTARRLELSPGPGDPVIEVVVADGHRVKRRLMKLQSISVGPFTVRDVMCTVPNDLNSKDSANSDDLLGDGFQSHFTCRLDMTAALLHLTPKTAAEPGTVATPAKSAVAVVIDGPFKEVGLLKKDDFAVVPQEVEARAAVNAVRAAKTTLRGEGMQRAGIARAMQANLEGLVEVAKQLADMNKQFEAVKKDPDAANRLIAPTNALFAQYNERLAKQADLRDRAARLNDSSTTYEQALQEAQEKTAAALKGYQQIQADEKVKAALAAYNKTAKPPAQLGPSNNLKADDDFVRLASELVAASAIPLVPDTSVPFVRVTLNGTLDIEMVWDSGATFVSLNGPTAKALHLHPSADDPAVELVLADGRKVHNRLMTLKSIRIGPYQVSNVQCVVPENLDTDHSPNLLGGTFQSFFLARLDLKSSLLRLMPLPEIEAPTRGKAGTTPTVTIIPLAPGSSGPKTPGKTAPAGTSPGSTAPGPAAPVAPGTPAANDPTVPKPPGSVVKAAPPADRGGAGIVVTSPIQFRVLDLKVGEPRLYDSKPLRTIEGVSTDLQGFRFTSIPQRLQMSYEVQVTRAGALYTFGFRAGTQVDKAVVFGSDASNWEAADGAIVGKNIAGVFRRNVTPGDVIKFSSFEAQLAAGTIEVSK